MADAQRISPEEARRDVASGRALLVCAYEDDAKCRQMMAEDAISFSEFEARAGSLRPDQEIVFYCA